MARRLEEELSETFAPDLEDTMRPLGDLIAALDVRVQQAITVASYGVGVARSSQEAQHAAALRRATTIILVDDLERSMVELFDGMLPQLGDLRGRVDQVGLFRVVVETEDGGHMYIPTDRFGREVYTVSSPERVFPVEVHIAADHKLTETDLENLRCIATLSPYRESGCSITVEPNAADAHRATVRFRSWSEDGARHARAHLTAAFASLQGGAA